MSKELLNQSTPRTKRIFDILFSAICLVLVSPVLIVLVFLIWIFYGRPIFFIQKRPGYKGRPFRLIKFRTMTLERTQEGKLLSDQKRLTRLGRFLRSMSLDELPELINVIRGEMSIVGPRPLLMKYLDLYSAEQSRRHDVLPGITGLAQVKGRNVITWQDKFEYDLWYVDNVSFGLDLKILAMTLWQVILRRGINQPGHATAQEFKGNQTPSAKQGMKEDKH